MAGQEQQRPTRREAEEPDEATAPPAASAAQVDTAGVDDLLDEIDEVLEANSETFVRGFVQKGGQ